jgi:hypothetical protein
LDWRSEVLIAAAQRMSLVTPLIFPGGGVSFAFFDWMEAAALSVVLGISVEGFGGWVPPATALQPMAMRESASRIGVLHEMLCIADLLVER